jgi:hypothetical protein
MLDGGVEEKSSLATGGRSIGVKVEEWILPVIRIVPTVIRIILVLDLHFSLGHENAVTTCKC